MEKVTAAEIMGWIFRSGSFNHAVLCPLYNDFVVKILHDCNVHTEEHSPVAVHGTGFRFSAHNLSLFIALNNCHEGKTWQDIMSPFHSELEYAVKKDSADVMNIVLLINAIQEQEESIIAGSSLFLDNAEKALESLDVRVRALSVQTNIRLASLTYSKLDVAAFLECIPHRWESPTKIIEMM
jgi:hypothetical protein